MAKDALATIASWVSYRSSMLDVDRVSGYSHAIEGKYWPDQDETDEVRAYVNHAFAQVRLRTAIASAQRPTMVFTPGDLRVPDEYVADIQRAYDLTWQRSRFDYRRMLGVQDSYTCSFSVKKIVFGQDGNIYFDILHPLQFLVPPGATDIQEMDGCAHVQDISLKTARTLARAYGQVDPKLVTAVRLTEFEDIESLLSAAAGSSSHITPFVEPSTSRVGYWASRPAGREGIPSGTEEGEEDGIVTAVELYRRDHRTRGITLTVLMGYTVVYHGPAPIRKAFPFAAYRPFPVTSSFFPRFFLRVFESTQDWASKILSLYLEALIDASTLWVLADQNAGLDLEDTEAGRGMNLVTYNAGAAREPTVLQAGRVDPNLPNTLPLIDQMIELQTGRTAALIGQNPPGVTSGDQLGRLIEQATTFMTPELIALEQCDAEIAKVWAEAAGYDVSEVYVEPGSSAGMRRASRAKVVLELAKIGALTPGAMHPITRKIVFKAVELPDAERVMDELEEAEKAQAQPQPQPQVQAPAPAPAAPTVPVAPMAGTENGSMAAMESGAGLGLGA